MADTENTLISKPPRARSPSKCAPTWRLDGRRRRRRSTRLVDAVPRRTARCSCSTRRTRCSARTRDPDRRRRCSGSARCRRPSARSAGSWPAPARLTDLVVNRARSLHLHHRADPGRRRGRARRGRTIVAAPEGDDAARPAARQRRRSSGPGTRRRSSRSSAATRRGRSRRRRAARARPARPGDPPADRRRPGPSRLRVALSAAHTLDQVRTLRAALDELGLA